jgi:DNA-binding response OmpR family regulator
LEQKPEIIFLDISMPDMNGLEFLGFLRGNLDDKTTPVVVLTANGNKDLVYQLLKMGITSYVLKPFTYETLKEKISEILSSMNVKGSE